LLAEEGNKDERGLRPLSNSLPLPNKKFPDNIKILLFGRGIKGVSDTRCTAIISRRDTAVFYP
jgi:hypothetical protein